DEEQEKKLCEIFREALNDKELEVKLVSLKTDELPAMITVEEQSRRFIEMSRQWGGGMEIPEKRTLTLNLKHPLVAYLTKDDASDEKRKLVCEQIFDLAEMARQPLVAERMVAFLKRSTQILSLAVEDK
ncbi:MAG: molecular chaperone HtpG, partial [Clostridia bacterium]|nr:molecular chaperone HtpG [Clostridia bacterium]